jgi:hypothetical protein
MSMATFQLPVGIPTHDIAEFVEELRCVASVEAVVTIEARDKREAVRYLEEVLSNFDATYRGTHDFSLRETLREFLRRTKAPFGSSGGYNLRPVEYKL